MFCLTHQHGEANWTNDRLWCFVHKHSFLKSKILINNIWKLLFEVPYFFKYSSKLIKNLQIRKTIVTKIIGHSVW